MKSALPTSTTLAAAAILLLGSVPFLPSLSRSRLLDDDHYVFDNPLLGDGWAALPRIWAGEYLMDYYPVTHTALWLESHLWGGSPLGFRVANVAWHAVGGLVMWWAAAAWRLPWPWLVAALWSVHPANVDAVCWISQHKSTVSALAFAAALGSYGKYLAARSQRWYWMALGAHALGMLAKTDVAMMPVLLVLLERWWWPRTVEDGVEPPRMPAVLRHVAPFFMVSAALGGVAVWFMRTRVVTSPIDMGGMVDRILKAMWAYGFYWRLAVWPSHLAAVYGEPQLPRQALLAGGVVLAVVIVAWFRRRQWGGFVLLGLAAMAALLLPVLYVAEQGFYRLSPVADRYLHLPLVVPAALMAAFLASTARRPRLSEPVVCVVGGVLLILACLTAAHARDYRSEATLWQAAVRHQPDAWYARFGIAANKLWDDGNYEAAIEQARHALAANPRHPPSHYVAGFSLLGLQRNGEAVAAFEKAIELEPRYAMAWLGLGESLLERSGPGDRDAAEAAFAQASRLPGAADLAACELARLSVAKGDTTAARQWLARVIDQPGPVRFEARLTSVIIELAEGDVLNAAAGLRRTADAMRSDRERDRLLAWASGFEDSPGDGEHPAGIRFDHRKAEGSLQELSGRNQDARRLRRDAELVRFLAGRRF